MPDDQYKTTQKTGLARIFTNPLSEYTPKVVTLWYRAPELLLGSPIYHSSVDIWAIGCIMGELLLSTPLLPGKNELHQMELICNLLGTPNTKIWPNFSNLPGVETMNLPNYPYNNLNQKFPNLSEHGINLLSRLLTYDPSKRITAAKALEHPYFKESPLPCPYTSYAYFSFTNECNDSYKYYKCQSYNHSHNNNNYNSNNPRLVYIPKRHCKLIIIHKLLFQPFIIMYLLPPLPSAIVASHKRKLDSVPTSTTSSSASSNPFFQLAASTAAFIPSTDSSSRILEFNYIKKNQNIEFPSWVCSLLLLRDKGLSVTP